MAGLVEAITDTLRERAWTHVVTHGAGGESGHPQHRFLHTAVTAALASHYGRYSAAERPLLLEFEQQPSTLLPAALQREKMELAVGAYAGRAKVHLSNREPGGMARWASREGLRPMDVAFQAMPPSASLTLSASRASWGSVWARLRGATRWVGALTRLPERVTVRLDVTSP